MELWKEESGRGRSRNLSWNNPHRLKGKPGTQKLGGPTQGREIRGTRPQEKGGFERRQFND